MAVERNLVVPLLILAVFSRKWRGASGAKGAVRVTSSWIPDWRESIGRHADPVDMDGIEHFYAVADALDQWAERRDMVDMEHAGGHWAFRTPEDPPHALRLQITGWLFRPCHCTERNSAEDCLHCLISRFSPVVDRDWLQDIRHKQIFMLHYSPIVPVLKTSADDTYELSSCTKVPEGQNLAGRIGRHWITESGKTREPQDIVLI